MGYILKGEVASMAIPPPSNVISIGVSKAVRRSARAPNSNSETDGRFLPISGEAGPGFGPSATVSI